MSRSQKIRDLCTENLLKDDNNDDNFGLDFVSSAGLNNATCASSKKLNPEVPNANRFSDMNTEIQAAQCSSATINLNPRPSDTGAPFPDEDNPNLSSDLVSTSNYITWTQAPANLITASTERQTAFKSSDMGTSNLIGTITERQRIRREIENSYDETLSANQEKDEKRDRIERSLSLQQIRKSRVPQEPDIQEDHIVMLIRHPALEKRRRIFRGDAKMNNVYDWVGSLSPEPMFLKFFCNNTDAIPPFDAASKYGLTTLNMEEGDKHLYFEDDKEITVKGFQGADDQNVFSVNSRILQEKEKLKLDDNIAPFTVDHHNVFNDLMKIYEDERVASRCISANFKGEDADDEGVTRDVFSEFFKFVFRFKSIGISSAYLVP